MLWTCHPQHFVCSTYLNLHWLLKNLKPAFLLAKSIVNSVFIPWYSIIKNSLLDNFWVGWLRFHEIWFERKSIIRNNCMITGDNEGIILKTKVQWWSAEYICNECIVLKTKVRWWSVEYTCLPVSSNINIQEIIRSNSASTNARSIISSTIFRTFDEYLFSICGSAAAWKMPPSKTFGSYCFPFFLCYCHLKF